VLYHSLHRTELDLRKMEKMGNHRIQLYVAIILFFYNYILSQQKTKKTFSQKANEPFQGEYWSIKDKGIQCLNTVSAANIVLQCKLIVLLLFSHFPYHASP